MHFVEHPLIKKKAMQFRNYQYAIFQKAREKSLLCCLPTGLGKTNIAILLTAQKLFENPSSKVMVLAPTKPLVKQHLESFRKFLELQDEDFGMVTGTVKPERRMEVYQRSRVIFATPQTILNDAINERIDMKDFSLLILDEVHHGVGRYAYPRLVEIYKEKRKSPLILGLTASPGSSREKIEEIRRRCGLEGVEIRNEYDPDVMPYVKKKKIEWIDVELPESFIYIKSELQNALRKRIEKLKYFGFTTRIRITKKGLLRLQTELAKKAREGYKKAFIGLRIVGYAIRIEHALELLETQGIKALNKYLQKLKREKSLTKELLEISVRIEELAKKGASHPKMSKLCSLIEEELEKNKDSKIIIFANFRDTVLEIVDALKKIDGAKPIEFFGQRGGLTQKKQIERLQKFSKGEYNILVCTSIGEEGLDIPAMDLAIFYEPVPSEIRAIQRRGRVGRQKFGRIVILITKGTRDEAYYWAAKQKERAMRRMLYSMSKPKQKNLNLYIER